jgi:hypothetical protein
LKKASQLVVISFSSAPLGAVPDDGDELAAGDDDDGAGGVELVLLLLHAARPRPTMHVSRIAEINLRVITQTFSSFLLALAILTLTLTSAWRHDPVRKSAILAEPAHNPGTVAVAAV